MEENNNFETIISVLEKVPERRLKKDLLILLSATCEIPFFRDYINSVHEQCCIHMKYEFKRKNHVIFSLGEIGDKFYLLLRGKTGVYVKSGGGEDNKQAEMKCVKVLTDGMSFGEMALMRNQPRLATLICQTDCHLATLDKFSFARILKRAEEEKLLLEMGFFAKMEIFSCWNTNLLKLLFLNTFRMKFIMGDCIFKEQDPIKAVYIICSGQFTATKSIKKLSKNIDQDDSPLISKLFQEQIHTLSVSPHDRSPKRTQQLVVWSWPEIFGEEDIISKNSKRTFSVHCSSSEAEVIVIKYNDFMSRVMWEDTSRKYLKDRLQAKESWFSNRLIEQENVMKQDQFSSYFGLEPIRQSRKIVYPKYLLHKSSSEQSIQPSSPKEKKGNIRKKKRIRESISSATKEPESEFIPPSYNSQGNSSTINPAENKEGEVNKIRSTEPPIRKGLLVNLEQFYFDFSAHKTNFFLRKRSESYSKKDQSLNRDVSQPTFKLRSISIKQQGRKETESTQKASQTNLTSILDSYQIKQPSINRSLTREQYLKKESSQIIYPIRIESSSDKKNTIIKVKLPRSASKEPQSENKRDLQTNDNNQVIQSDGTQVLKSNVNPKFEMIQTLYNSPFQMKKTSDNLKQNNDNKGMIVNNSCNFEKGNEINQVSSFFERVNPKLQKYNKRDSIQEDFSHQNSAINGRKRQKSNLQSRIKEEYMPSLQDNEDEKNSCSFLNSFFI